MSYPTVFSSFFVISLFIVVSVFRIFLGVGGSLGCMFVNINWLVHTFCVCDFLFFNRQIVVEVQTCCACFLAYFIVQVVKNSLLCLCVLGLGEGGRIRPSKYLNQHNQWLCKIFFADINLLLQTYGVVVAFSRYFCLKF